MSIQFHSIRFRTTLHLLLLGCLFQCSVSLGAESSDSKSTEKSSLVLPEVFSDHMVLQRKSKVPIWGQAPNGSVVTVSFANHKLSTTAQNGKWKVILPSMPASSSPRKLTIECNNGSKVAFEDVLVGDVWLASGQSNMEMQLGSAKGAKKAIEASANPHLRFFKVDKRLETTDPPLGIKWRVAGPSTSPGMSAVGYHFVNEIQKTQGIPIGLLQCAYGGTVTETWCSPKVMAQSWPVWERFLEQVRSKPAYPVRNKTPSHLYNRMLKTVMPFAVKGFLWYQGEGNAGRAEEQKKLFPTMVADWRESWGDSTLPFYIVQLARYEAADWHAFRCAQLDVWKNTPNSYMAVTIDLSKEPGNHPIHPKAKAPIGHRLALAARANVYGEKDLVYSGPIIRSMAVKKGAAVLSFDQIGSGLIASDNQPLRGFYISAEGGKFVKASAKINGDTVVVQSSDIKKPVAVRYGAEADMGKKQLDVNLSNREKLPASPFTISIKPETERTVTLRGTVTEVNGVRSITGTKESFKAHNNHGPITYYKIPFNNGRFSCSWKVESEQKVVFVFDGKSNGKATHAMKVFINGSPVKNSKTDEITLLTYDGSTKQKKKAKLSRHKHHAEPGQWHKISVTFEGKQATVVLDGKSFTATSDRFRQPFEKTGIGHAWGTLHTKDVKINSKK